MNKPHRNNTIDCIKGILIVMVVVRHVLQFSVLDEGGIVGNVIWAVQMPGFMFISGFFSAKAVNSFHDLIIREKNCFLRYFIPFISWFFLVDVLILGKYKRNFLIGFESLISHPEYGLWFLWVVFVLSIVINVCNYIFTRHNALVKCIGTGVVFFGSLLALAVMSIIYGNTSFLGMKYVLYYSLYYYVGWLMKCINPSIPNGIKEIALCFFVVLFFYIVLNYDLYHCEDNVFSIGLRIIAAFSGNYLLFSVVAYSEAILTRLRSNIFGRYTLEIYATHIHFCSLIDEKKSTLFSIEGFENFIISLVFTLLFTGIVIVLLKSNCYTNFLMYGCKNRLSRSNSKAS